ncbi:hypothetical protein ILFOPFJJ_02678 [Ensifer psoraleae]|nr:hypothetical protein [Sinorhizobium psoraleae]
MCLKRLTAPAWGRMRKIPLFLVVEGRSAIHPLLVVNHLPP